MSAHNALIKLDETDSAGKGRKFKSRFITPGLAGYPDQFGNVLIQKETFDKFINSMVGVPVVIRHKDLTQNNADDERVGVVSTVWFDDKDGWYWCDGIIWDETAINLITDKGWSVSCSYDVLEVDDSGGTWNNTPYDMEFLNGIFTHLALVDNPRYEKANIVFNSKTILNNKFKEEEHPRDEDGKFTSGTSYYNENTQTIELKGDELGKSEYEIREKAVDYYKTNLQGKTVSNDELGDILFSRVGLNKLKTNSADINKLKVLPAIPDIIQHGKYQGSEDLEHERNDGIAKFHRINGDVSVGEQKENMSVLIAEDVNGNRFYNLNHKSYKAENSSRVIRAKGRANEEFSINIITNSIQDFNPKTPNIKENDAMTIIEELKKLIYKAENEKGDCMKKANNEDVDKREILREADAIAMKPASDFKGGEEEKFRTLTKKLEELSYNKSERGTSDNEKDDDEKTDDVEKEKKADNESEKDEEEYKDFKREIKEDADNRKSCKNKADNSKHSYFDELNKVYNAPQKPKEENLYVSRDEKLKAAEEYFS